VLGEWLLRQDAEVRGEVLPGALDRVGARQLEPDCDRVPRVGTPLLDELPLLTLAMPTLVIGATHDTMDPEHMRWVSTQVQHGTFLLCPNGSHLAMWDDQAVYLDGLEKWIHADDAH